MSLEDIKDLKVSFARLNTNKLPSCISFLPTRKAQVVNKDLELFYNHNILRYRHIVIDVLKCPEVMELLDVIYNLMQLHERLFMKHKQGERIDEIKNKLESAYELYETITGAIIVRLWRHAKIGMLADLNVQAIKMFKMNFITRFNTL